METINETISKAKNEVKELIRTAHDKQLEPEPGRTMMESFENRVNQVLPPFIVITSTITMATLHWLCDYEIVTWCKLCSGPEQGS